MSNVFGRQVVLPLTNKSGGGVIAGDVVVVDTTNNDAFTTTTSAGFTGGVGIAQETIANNAVGRVLVGGYAALVNVNASVTRGNFGKTHTVAKQGTDAGASRGAGTFCQFLTGGTTPSAMVYPVDLLGSSLTNPMTTSQDVIVGGVAGAPGRLAVGAAGAALSVINGAIAYNSGTSFPGSVVTGDRYYRTDLGAEYRYDGTRWLSMDLRSIELTNLDTNSPWSTTVDTLYGALPGAPTSLYLVDFVMSILYTLTNTGSAYWGWALKYRDAANASQALSGTVSFDTSADGAGTAMVRKSVAANQVLNTNARMLVVAQTKTGAPTGGCYLRGAVTYRHIAT